MAARVAAGISALLATACLVGWSTHSTPLTALLPHYVAMKFNTGLCLLFCSIALGILAGNVSAAARRVAQCASFAVVCLALATLAEYFLGVNFGIDEAFVSDPSGNFDVFHGRMSPYSAAALLALGAALMATPQPRWLALSRWGAALTTAIGSVSILGYLWDAAELVTDSWLPPVALNTAICLALLGVGLLCRPVGGSSGHVAAERNPFAIIELKILVGFIASMSLLMVGGNYIYRSDVRFADSVESIADVQAVRGALAALYGGLAGADVAMRDYFLTSSDADRSEYERQAHAIGQQRATLRRLIGANPVQAANLAALDVLIDARLDTLASALRAHTDFGLPAARAVLTVGRRASSTRTVGELVKRMDAQEQSLLTLRRSATKNVQRSTLMSLLVTLVVAGCLFTISFRGIHREMLARRAAEIALRASERYSRGIVDSSPDCLAVLDLDGRLLQLTPQGRRLMEVDDFTAIEASDWLARWAESNHTAVRAAFDSARSGLDARFQGYCPTLKGQPKWWDVMLMPIRGADDQPLRVLAVARDISDVRRAEEQLVKANRFLDSLIENLPVAVTVVSAADLRVVRVNRETERLYGAVRSDMLGKTARELAPAAEAEISMAADRRALASAGLVEIPELSIERAQLGARVVHTMKIPIAGDDGTPQFLLTIAVDITGRKLAETAIRELNGALEAKAEQLTATVRELESFSYTVSHDLRAPLRAVDGFAEMMEEDYGARLDAEGRRYLAVIRKNSRRMGVLIDDLLAFSRLGRLAVVPQEIDTETLVREVVEETLDGHGRMAPRIEIGALPAARGDPALLRQVWANLISNAIKYSSKSPVPHIEVSGRHSGGETEYSVRDNGVGFDMDYADQLFGVFQRLHRAEEFSGTGVGLAIVQRVVSLHGGRVWAEGKVNAGAVFSFALPTGVCNV